MSNLSMLVMNEAIPIWMGVVLQLEFQPNFTLPNFSQKLFTKDVKDENGIFQFV